MDNYTPELGQMVFSNNEPEEFAMQAFVERGLEDLGEAIQAAWLCDAGFREGADPTSNSGVSYETAVFAIRSYCWCDADHHPQGCPPNFEHKQSGFRASWYKYLGRGSSQNRLLSRKEWAAIRNECLADIALAPPIPESDRFLANPTV